MKNFKVYKISYDQTKDWLLNKHYAQRMPSISYAFGLYKENNLVGVLTVGKPVSHWLCKNVAGEEYQDKVFELNRLVTNNNLPKNHLSFFVSKALKLMSEDNLILVSYADNGMGHHGYIYQATNWIYTGKTNKRTDKYTPSGKHARHYDDDDKTKHLRKVRHSKYRYVYFTNKKMRKNPEKYLNTDKYPIIDEYPKGDNDHYEFGDRKKDEIINRKTGKHFYQ